MRDERLVVGFLVFHLLVAAPGFALLSALGLVRLRPQALLAAAGPAFVVGAVAAGVPLIALVVLGVPVTPAVSLAVVGAVTLALVLVARLMRPAEVSVAAHAGDAPPRVEVVIERLVLGAIAVYFTVGSLAFTHVPTLWDDANIWSFKGMALFHHDGLIDGVGRNPQLSFVHLDYPILHPLLESSFFHAIGGQDLRLWHLELWLIFAALIWTLAWLLAPLGRRWLWVLVLAVVSVSGILIANITLGDADTTMAAYVGCAALSFGIWLDRGHRAHALLGAVFLAGGANVKNEGMAFGLAVGIALVIALMPSGVRARWRDLALAAAIAVLSVLPWQAWVATNPAAARATPSPWELIDDPSFLVDRLSYLWRGIQQIAVQLTTTAEWGLIFPAFVVVALALVVVGRHRAVATYYGVASLLAIATVAYTYWVTSISDLGGFEQRTGPRIVLGIIFIIAAGLAHLLQLATRVAVSPGAEPKEPSSAEAREPRAEVGV